MRCWLHRRSSARHREGDDDLWQGHRAAVPCGVSIRVEHAQLRIGRRVAAAEEHDQPLEAYHPRGGLRVAHVGLGAGEHHLGDGFVA